MTSLASGWLSVFTNFSKTHYPPTFRFNEGPWEDSRKYIIENGNQGKQPFPAPPEQNSSATFS